MRRLLSWLFIVGGVLAAVAGAGAAFLFGPDDRATTGPHSIRIDGVGLVTAPRAIAYAGPRLRLTVHSEPPARQVFAGVAHHVDVRDFLRQAPYTRIDQITLPWDIATTDVAGTGKLAAAPSSTDIWTTQAKGRGSVTLDWLLIDAPQDLVVVDANGRRMSSVALSASVVLRGSFVGGLALVALGLGLAVVGVAVASASRAARRAAAGNRKRRSELHRRAR